MDSPIQHFRLIINCPDQIGIVATVSRCIAEHHGLIIEANHHSDLDTQWFFMRQAIQFPANCKFEALSTAIGHSLDALHAEWQLIDTQQQKRVVILASQQTHCINELLYRFNSGNMPGKLIGVISNHAEIAQQCQPHQLPFYHIPIEQTADFEKLHAQLDQLQPDVIVLARYMQILPDTICHAYRHQIINIHHSFLPSFSGGKAYQQAYDHGVKLIGATCHYVSKDLDQGPIIEQDVARISHCDNVQDLKRLGQEVEKRVLANGLYKHLLDRIIVHQNKTIVF